MEHNMILSASGWRKVFVESLNENDKTSEIGKLNSLLCVLIGETFAQFIIKHSKKKSPIVAVGIDTRPTGPQIADSILRALVNHKINVKFLDVCAAPEIMAYAKKIDGFVYISASHNPIGHNGIKFGLNDGGVVSGEISKLLAQDFKLRCEASNSEEHASEILNSKDLKSKITKIKKCKNKNKSKALKAYYNFMKIIVTGENSKSKQKEIFKTIKKSTEKNPLTILSDMNGSSRTLSIDKDFFENNGIKFISFNERPGQIVHEIIPEPENLVWAAQSMEELQISGKKEVKLAYMPDCDGDRGNIVFWDEKNQKAKIIKAQEVFALCVMAELSFENWKNSKKQNKLAVAVNCPTSMRIDEICKAFSAHLFRAEVGEANVVNLAREKRKEGFNVRILGEGSNGGNITNPSNVRDPLSSIFAIIKLLTIRDYIDSKGNIKKGLFHLWCEKSNQEKKYKSDFTLIDILESLPAYTTTGVSEKRAILKIQTEDKGKLKLRFQKIFEQEWKKQKETLKEKYKFESYQVVCTNGTKEIIDAKNWNNENGGLKIKFFDADNLCRAFIWMRPSGTEPVFRVLCDVKGSKPQSEKSLLEWETSILKKADNI